MKTIKFLGILLIAYFVLLIPIQSCDKHNDDTPTGDTCSVDYKPNIYIYPTKQISLKVSLNFPKGGKITTSIPKYGNGWDINVDTNGIINKKYSYLFYECKHPDKWQRNKGWIVNQEDLKVFFIKNMTNYGFRGQEITDFIDYWIPRFKTYKYYMILPQTKHKVDDVITLNISEKPDNILRLFYVVKGYDSLPDKKITEPKISKQFKRENYFVTEWGVVLK